jgi:hypothetical protein
MAGVGQIMQSSSFGGGQPRHEIRNAGRGGVCQELTDCVEVLYVHATIKVEGSTERVERVGGGQRRGGEVSFYSNFSTFIRSY